MLDELDKNWLCLINYFFSAFYVQWAAVYALLWLQYTILSVNLQTFKVYNNMLYTKEHHAVAFKEYYFNQIRFYRT